MKINLIVAIDNKKVIGKTNTIPWRCPSDLKRFKRLTLGHKMLMGRKTFESLPGILPKREHLIITREKINIEKENVIYFNSILNAINYAKESGETELFIIGGGEIYEQCINIVDRIYLTIVDCTIEDGDTFFKFINSDFRDVYKEKILKETNTDEFNTDFFILERK